MEKLIFNNKEFTYYEYSNENEFEEDVVKNASRIFGEKSIYFDIKKELVIRFCLFQMGIY